MDQILDIESVIAILGIVLEYIKYRSEKINYVFQKWLTKNEIKIPNNIFEYSVIKLDKFIFTTCSDPIQIQ